MTPPPVLQRLIRAYEELSGRERLMLLLATLLVLSFAAAQLLIQPMRQEQRRLATLLENQRLERDTLQRLAVEQPQALAQEQAALQAEHDRLAAIVADGQALLAEARRHRQIDAVLRRLSVVDGPTELEVLKLEPPQALALPAPPAPPPAAEGQSAAPVAPPPAPLPPLHTRDLQITLVSDFAHLTRYLQALEHSGTGWFWQSAELTTLSPPRNRLRVTLRVLTDGPEELAR